MKVFAFVPFAIALSACSASKERRHRAYMDHLEKRVQLPRGSRPVRDYHRYYAPGDHGDVLAVYLLRDNDPQGEERRWFDDRRELPFIDGEGCSEVNLVLDKATGAVKKAACNVSG